jgi:hypothetical protein
MLAICMIWPLSLILSQPKPSDNVLFFKPLKPQMSYRLVDLWLPRVRGELAREQWVLSPEQIAAGG